MVGLGAIAIACGMVSSSVGAQEMIDPPEQDGAMSADFEEVFRIGSFDGETWETFSEGPRVQMITAGPGGGRQQVSQDGIKQMTFYPELPVLMAADASWSGKIWVQRRGKEPTEEEPIDVLTPPDSTSAPSRWVRPRSQPRSVRMDWPHTSRQMTSRCRSAWCDDYLRP